MSLLLYANKHYFATIIRSRINDIICYIGGITMNVLERILYYRKQKNWTEYQLAEKSGLTQSTISSWYRKNMLPTIPSLEKICDAFGITLAQFFSNNSDSFTLTPLQRDLLIESTRLTEEQQRALLDFFKTL